MSVSIQIQKPRNSQSTILQHVELFKNLLYIHIYTIYFLPSSLTEGVPYVPHICYVGEKVYSSSLGSCFTFERIKNCCCAPVLVKECKYDLVWQYVVYILSMMSGFSGVSWMSFNKIFSIFSCVYRNQC